MDTEKLKAIIEKWAAENSLIKRAYIFGSRARDDWRLDSDLDIALEFHSINEVDEMAIFLLEKQELINSLKQKIPYYRLQIEWHDRKGGTPNISKAIKESSILVYDEKTG